MIDEPGLSPTQQAFSILQDVVSPSSPVLRARGRIERITSVICEGLTAEPMGFIPMSVIRTLSHS